MSPIQISTEVTARRTETWYMNCTQKHIEAWTLYRVRDYRAVPFGVVWIQKSIQEPWKFWTASLLTRSLDLVVHPLLTKRSKMLDE